jgi:hypothetical protein
LAFEYIDSKLIVPVSGVFEVRLKVDSDDILSNDGLLEVICEKPSSLIKYGITDVVKLKKKEYVHLFIYTYVYFYINLYIFVYIDICYIYSYIFKFAYMIIYVCIYIYKYIERVIGQRPSAV